MRRVTVCRCWRQGGLLALIAIMAVGCVPEEAANPKLQSERGGLLLERILAQLEEEKPAYSMVKEIIADGVPVPVIQSSGGGAGLDAGFQDWKLYDSINRLRIAGFSASMIRPAGVSNTEAVQAEASSSEWTKLVRKDWEGTLQSLQTGAEAIMEKQASMLQGKQAELLRSEMLESVRRSQSRLEEMIRTMEAAGSCTFTVKKGSTLPDTVVLENRLHYMAEGSARSEIIRLTYRLEGTGKAYR